MSLASRHLGTRRSRISPARAVSGWGCRRDRPFRLTSWTGRRGHHRNVGRDLGRRPDPSADPLRELDPLPPRPARRP